MDPIDFLAALAYIRQTAGPDAIQRIFREVRPPSSYLFAQILPERNRPTYSVDTSGIRIVATMAGLSGMDSPYPTGGAVTVESFLEKTGKTSIDIPLLEATLREMQLLVLQQRGDAAATNETVAGELIGFTGVAVQALQDTAEWLRGQALMFGEIDWTFNGQRLLVDYQIPASQFIDTATGAEGYGGANSTFWADIRAGMKAVNYDVESITAHIDTVLMIMDNPANRINVLSQDNGVFRFQRHVGNLERASTDNRDTITIRAYQAEGEVLDPTNPGTTKKLPFCPPGRLLITGRGSRPGYVVGQGAQVSPESTIALGYTHVAPTVEGGGAQGRWGRTYVPQDQPWTIRTQGVQNLLPVIESRKKIAVLSTEMA